MTVFPYINKVESQSDLTFYMLHLSILGWLAVFSGPFRGCVTLYRAVSQGSKNSRGKRDKGCKGTISTTY